MKKKKGGEEVVAMALTATTTKLSTGASIPLLALGTAGASDPDTIRSSIITALQLGYRHIDTASLYGSEAAIGEALSEAFESGLVQRHELFITSKVWCSEMDDVVSAIRRSLSALKLAYLDLYLVHWPLKFTSEGMRLPKIGELQPLDIPKTWKAMEECVELGLAKAIGVSNFSSKKILDLLQTARIRPTVNQVEMHPRWQQKHLRKTCNEANIHVCAWSPLGAPEKKWGSYTVLEHPVIKEISKQHGNTPAQVALRWGIEQGVSVLPKSYNKTRILENSQIFDWTLTSEDHEKIATIEQKANLPGPFLEGGSIYNEEGLWDGEYE